MRLQTHCISHDIKPSTCTYSSMRCKQTAFNSITILPAPSLSVSLFPRKVFSKSFGYTDENVTSYIK